MKETKLQNQRGEAGQPSGEHATSFSSEYQTLCETIVKAAPVGLVGIDSIGRILAINSVALEIFELNRDDLALVGQAEKPSLLIQLLPQSEQIRWQSLINLVLSTGLEVNEPRFFYQSDHLERILFLKIVPLRLPSSDPGILITVEEITEQITNEKLVILSEKLASSGGTIATVAHELNDILTPIVNHAELLSSHAERQQFDKAAFNARSIVDGLFSMRDYVQSLRDASTSEPEFITFDIRILIDDLLFSLRKQGHFAAIHFNIDFSATAPPIEMDVGQIRQVIENLLTNAADAIQERIEQYDGDPTEYRREISVKVWHCADEKTVTTEICDNGIGMSDETLAKAFKLHFTTKKTGHGLGLFSSLNIAQRHGGELTAESKRFFGSTFFLTLPRTQSDN